MTEVRQTLKRFLAGDQRKVFCGDLIPGSSPVRIFADDEDLREAIEASMRKVKLGLAELWVNGVSIDWELLPDARFGRLIRMPGLPFMAERLPPTGADQESGHLGPKPCRPPRTLMSSAPHCEGYRRSWRSC